LTEIILERNISAAQCQYINLTKGEEPMKQTAVMPSFVLEVRDGHEGRKHFFGPFCLGEAFTFLRNHDFKRLPWTSFYMNLTHTARIEIVHPVL
jgi:hypothetical protein